MHVTTPCSFQAFQVHSKKKKEANLAWFSVVEPLPRAYHLLTPGGGDDRPRERGCFLQI